MGPQQQARARHGLTANLGCAQQAMGGSAGSLQRHRALRVVGHPVAMANAHSVVLAGTPNHVGDVEEGGLEQAIASRGDS